MMLTRARTVRLAAALTVATSMVGTSLTILSSNPASAAAKKYLTVGGMFPFKG